MARKSTPFAGVLTVKSWMILTRKSRWRSTTSGWTSSWPTLTTIRPVRPLIGGYISRTASFAGELINLGLRVASHKQKVVVLFEGHDAAGKGGIIKRITQRLNPRICRVAARPAPNERERTPWYFQRYATHLPAGGEIVLFDRS